MRYRSIKNPDTTYSLKEAITMNIAPDGSLLVPESIPQFSAAELKGIPAMSLHEIAYLVMEKWVGDELSPADIKDVVDTSITFPLPLNQVGHNKVFELFHGPTHSYKDIPSLIFAKLIQKLFRDETYKPKMLVATSGFSGPSIAHGFAPIPEVDVILLYSKHEIDELEKELITHVPFNIFPVEVDGTADECRHLVNKAFADQDLSNIRLVTANTINIGCLISHVIAFIYLYSLTSSKKLRIMVPQAKFGNVTAILMAKLMGIPMEKVTIASLASDKTVEHFLASGKVLDRRSFYDLFSGLNDMSVVYDFPRVVHLCDNSVDRFEEHFDIYTANDSVITSIIHTVTNEFSYLVNPRVAVAWASADSLSRHTDTEVVIIADSSALKQRDKLFHYTGLHLDPKTLTEKFASQPLRKCPMTRHYKDFKQYLLDNFDP